MDSGIESAFEILSYAEEELRRALATNDVFLFRNAADKAFLALVVGINAYIRAKNGVTPRSHSERRKLLRKMKREDLRALYSDLMKTLHEEAFYEGKFDPEEVRYAFERVREILMSLREELSKSEQSR